MSQTNSSTMNSDECLIEAVSLKKRPILQRHLSESVLSSMGPGGKILKKSHSKFFKELNAGNLYPRLSDVGLKETDVDLMVAGVSFKAVSEYIKNSNLQGLKLFLDNRHVNIEDKDEDGCTVLIFAAGLGRLDFIPLLLSQGADINAEDNDKSTALHWAAREGCADVCLELLEQGADIEASDSGQWTPLLWACYRGHVAAADCLISRGANINARGVYQVSSLLWASGRGHFDVVQLLIDNNVKIDIGDKYGTTALIWACRKGHLDIVELLLRAGASVDAVGMYSWTPLLVATRGNFVQIVEKLIEKSPNINTVDKDGMTALTIACKEGYQEIAFMLLAAGAYTNLPDRSGDTNLIYACKGGHKSIVEALIKKYADVDVKGKDNKTCLHWAIDKNQTVVVKLILGTNPDLEAKTSEGDTPLLRAVRQRNGAVVEMLLEQKAKVSAADNKGDTALHIAMRARSKGIVEILLRNPKNSQLLYRPNRQGETPYNIDAASQKTIMGQIFGARKLNANEDGENILGYDLYSSALADILTEPGLIMPITVGLYAKWGSGKSFLLGKLKDEMLSFTKEWFVEPAFKNSVLLFLIVLHIASIAGLIGWIVPYSAFNLYEHSIFIGLGVASFIFVVSYLFLVILWKGTLYYDWYSLYNMQRFMAERFHSLKLVLDVMFSHPPGSDALGGGDNNLLNQRAQPLRLLFTDKTKVVTSAGGQNSVTQMLGSLFDAVEDQYGVFATRLYRAFKPAPLSPTSRIAWRRLCCIPYVIIYLTCFVCVTSCIILIAVTIEYSINNKNSAQVTTPAPNVSTEYTELIEESVSQEFVFGLLLTLAVIVGATVLANIYTIGNCLSSLAFSQRKHLQRAMAKLDIVKSEGYLQALKNEVQMMIDMVTCLDAFTGQRTRLVVIVDGLDSCEQTKVLSVLDAVHMLFSDDGSPFIILLAIDPHVITKAIELNIHQVYRDTSISGDAYLRNLVHMPFFLQNVSLRRVTVAQQTSGILSFGMNKKSSTLWLETDDHRRMSTESSATRKKGGGGKHSKSFFRRTRHDSISSSIGSRLNHAGTSGGGTGDMALISLTDDYFSDVNVKSVRRFMNVIYVMGRLMKAFNIDFSWYHLGVWVNISEQWPYRLSWLVFFFEMNEEMLEDSVPLKELYDRVKGVMPTQKEIEPLLEMDRDEKKLEALLSMKKKMTVRDLKTFLPFSINLDPYIKKVIKDEYQIHEEVVQQGHTATLTSRQAAGLSRKISGHDPNAPSVTMSGATNTQILPQFQHYGMGHMPPWQLYHPSHAGLGYDPRGSSPPDHVEVDLDPELSIKPLTKKTVEDICQLLRTVDGLTSGRVETYCDAVTSQNISGAVLSHCKIEELKNVLNMNFGDWELFQLVVFALRERERKMKMERKTLTLQPPAMGSRRPSPLPSSPDRKRRIGMISEASSQSQAQQSSGKASSASLNKVPSTLESQVTFEDAMISGLLSTLNEEAQEDVLSEEFDLTVQGSSENVSIRSSMENIPRGLEPTSPATSSAQKYRDLEKGTAAAGPPNKSHSVVATSIGGGGGSMSWDFGSQSDLGMISVPTSPTSSQSPVIPAQGPVTRNKSSEAEKSTKRKPRHIRDRLDSLSEEDRLSNGGGTIGRTMSRSFAASGNGTDSFLTGEDQEDEPYAWISQTAPASPLGCRSRAGSIIPDEEPFVIGPSDLAALHYRESKRRGTITTYNSKESIYMMDPSSTSMDKLTDKVKKKIRHALLAMDHHHSGMPAFQRAKPTGGSMRAHFYVSDPEPSKSKPKIFARANSMNQTDMTRLAEEYIFKEVEEEACDEIEESVCSSPEQETVAKRPDSGFRGPPVHQLFVNPSCEPKEHDPMIPKVASVESVSGMSTGKDNLP